MVARGPFTDKQHGAFCAWYGRVLLERGPDDKGVVSIRDDHRLLERAFRAGWKWGETEAGDG